MLIGEPLALDLINTRPLDTDLIATPDLLRRWLDLEADRLPGFDGVLSEDDVTAVRGVRDHASAAVHALLSGERPGEAALRGLNDAQRAAPAVRELSWDGAALTATEVRTGPPGVRLAAALAEAAADLLGDQASGRIRQCEAHDCVMLFLPAHPRRRWCAAALCGNRARVARHYRRHRTV
ncbi:CGNR zinc finger domain-containing protein [Nonomuraea mangrovi]|uniref:CGNR zinc finger domain-containing protein n=1 Tax=Nonomuraea mangrovi TaxID=2316207 RepID=A0ABW4SKX3_9ACTN